MHSDERKKNIRWLQIMLIIGSLGLMYHDSLLSHMRTIADPLHLNDDARSQIWPLVRYYTPSLFVDDYIAEYYLRCILPLGFRTFYRLGSLWWDPRALSKVLPYPLLLAALIALGLAASRLGGKAAAWAAVALALSTGVFLERMTGGLPRSFGYPLLACAAAALIYGRPLVLAACVVLGAGFYPVVGLIAGLALAVYLILLPRGDRGHAAGWTLRTRILVVVATALLSGLVLLPNALGCLRYGPMVGPAQAEMFPEVGRGGRFSSGDRVWETRFLPANWAMLSKTIRGAGDPWLPALKALVKPQGQLVTLGVLVIILIGAALLALRDAEARRLLALLAAAVIGYSVAKIATPLIYHPDRYVMYPIPILVLILLPASASALANLLGWFGQKSWSKPTFVLVVCGFLLVAQGGRGPTKEGIWLGSKEREAVLRELKRLPQDAMIAGWPRGAMDEVPYLAERRALATKQTHEALYSRYILEMRKRVLAIIDAYYATDVGPLVRLRDEFGVTHFLVDRRHFGEKPATYFQPFTDYMERVRAQVRQGDLEVLRQIDPAAVYDAGDHVVLDLRRLKTGAAAHNPRGLGPGGPAAS